jgi:hypothetical protein
VDEVFPVVAGFVAGLLVQRIRTIWLRVSALIVLCLLLGLTASYISGELAISWGFLSVDAALVWLGAAMSVVLVAGWRQWSRRSMSR